MLGISPLSPQTFTNPYQFNVTVAGVSGASPRAGNAATATPASSGAEGTSAKLAAGKVEECQTCKNRKYQDGSNDPGVSFKSPTHVSPEQSASAVRAHENEHVNREQSKAQQEGREVVSQNVQIHTSVCPECGKTYTSGGTTTTTTREKQKNPAAENSNQEPGQIVDRYR